MKNDLDHFRKFSITDFRVNTKKFKEYLEFCKKNELQEEKKFIMESIINQANDKSTTGVENLTQILKDLTNLCVLTVIFSDFEIENFLKIQNFSLNFQKAILFETINYCYDRQKEQQDYIYIKFQFWVLKLMNKNIALTGDVNPLPPISSEELNQSLESLHKKIDQELFNQECPSIKIFLLKVSYELGYYHYLMNDFNQMNFYFTFCIHNFSCDGINSKSLYFDVDSLISLIEFVEKNPQMFGKEDIGGVGMMMASEMAVESLLPQEKKTFDFESKENLVENDFASVFNKMTISPQDKLIIEKYSIDDLKLVELLSIEEVLHYSENLIFVAFKNFSKLQDSIVFTNKVKELFSQRIGLSGESEKKELAVALKEVSYHLILLKIIESIYNGEEKLPKGFLINLSNTILKQTLTSNLKISGMIHGLIINFSQNFNSILNYFNDFVEFFQNTESSNRIETINQINFISQTLKIINILLNSSSKMCEITGEQHYQMLNSIFFWLECPIQSYKENIAFILIKTIKNSDYLLVLKIILLGALKFVDEKKSISSSSNDEIFDEIYSLNPNFYKIDTLINENHSHKKMSTITIAFKEDNPSTRQYNFDALNLQNYQQILFILLHKVEKKIIKYGKFSEVEYLNRRVNLLFFQQKDCPPDDGGLSSSLPKSTNIFTNKQSLKYLRSDQIIHEYIKYYKSIFAEFKIKYFRVDIIEDVNQVIPLYEEFRAMLDEIVLLRFIYILSSYGKSIEASIMLQYFKRIDYDLAYKLLKKNCTSHNIDTLQYIWKIVYFEYLANVYYQNNKEDYLSYVSSLLKRTSNHQYFKKHPLRKHFKIINFFKFIDNLS